MDIFIQHYPLGVLLAVCLGQLFSVWRGIFSIFNYTLSVRAKNLVLTLNPPKYTQTAYLKRCQ